MCNFNRCLFEKFVSYCTFVMMWSAKEKIIAVKSFIPWNGVLLPHVLLNKPSAVSRKSWGEQRTGWNNLVEMFAQMWCNFVFCLSFSVLCIVCIGLGGPNHAFLLCPKLSLTAWRWEFELNLVLEWLFLH